MMYYILYSNAVRRFKCEGWHFTHVKTIYMTTSKRGSFLAHKTNLTQPLLIEVPVTILKSERSRICVLRLFVSLYDIEIWFWNCSGSVVWFFIVTIRFSHPSRISLNLGIFIYIGRLHRIVLKCVTSGAWNANPYDAHAFTPSF